MKSDKVLIEEISKRYGAVIDLDSNPEVMIEIIRLIRSMYAAEPGTPDGGGGPTGPTSRQSGATNNDILKAVLRVARDVRGLGKSVPVRSGRAKRRSK